MSDRPPRRAVPLEQTWDLDSLYATAADWEADADRLSQELHDLSRFRGHLGDSAASLLAGLEAATAAVLRLQRTDIYARNQREVDGENPVYQALFARALQQSAAAGAALAFIQSEVLAIPEARYQAFLAAEPALAPFRPHLDRLRRLAPHTLSPETEEALAMLGGALSAPYAIHLAIDTDIKFPSFSVDGRSMAMSTAHHEALLTDQSREVRRQAHAALGEGLRQHRTGMAAALAAYVQNTVATARVHRYDSALQASIKPYNLPESVYRTTLDVLRREGAPHTRRLLALRQRVLGLDQVMHYDVKAPLDPAPSEPLAFGEAAAEIEAGLAVLGPDYQAMLRRAFSERWIDWADNDGKSHGAFCAGIYDFHPVIFISWLGQYRDMFILAHELGHAGHAYLQSKHQHFSNAGAFSEALYFIESPSTCNEVLLGNYLLGKHTDTRRRRRVLETLLDTFWHNLVTHLLQAEVERRLFDLAEAGRPVTLAAICEAQEQTFHAYFGDSLGLTETDRLIWMTVPHYYAGFYPLVYGAGLAAACAVAEAIGREGEPAVQRWLRALQAGTSLEPLDLYALAGVDMSRPETIRAGVDYYGRLASELEACYPSK